MPLEIKPVRPGQRPKFEKNAREEFRIAQRLDHRAALRDKVGEVPLSFRSVGEAQAQTKPAQFFDLYDLDNVNHSLSSGPGICWNGSCLRPRCQFSANSA